MLDYEYKKLQEQSIPRNWPLTVVMFVLAGMVMIGIIVLLKYFATDRLTALLVVAPAFFVFILLLLAGLNGRSKAIINALDIALYSLFFWR